ncbi:MAG TPA: HAMP domain-containing sensor histidine kinase [Methylomirabilota bacterium]|nr:HAMP domain-containing sensor histidine kinase [Methylomirabilota bacterium]
MNKAALIFVLAVLAPSLVLAWLAVRSLRDQQYLIERQQSLLLQDVADGLVGKIDAFLDERQREFASRVESLVGSHQPTEITAGFDDALRKDWPLASVGFVVTLDGEALAPSPSSREEAQQFWLNNNVFLCSGGTAEVYWNAAPPNSTPATAGDANTPEDDPPTPSPGKDPPARADENPLLSNATKSPRKVIPQKSAPGSATMDSEEPLSKVSVVEAEFRQLVGDGTEGTVARFLQNQLHLLLWYRSPSDPQIVFGAQLDVNRLIAGLLDLVEAPAAHADRICVALLNEHAQPVARSLDSFHTDWRRPFVAAEIGETLPHWEVAVYLLDPARLSHSAALLRWTLGLLILLLLSAVCFGGWLIVTDTRRQLALARQKTDFVSNVSHELKTPLTSIRMFSELLADPRVTDGEKRRSYLGIITAETARLTRLINNVLDFSRMDRGEKNYHFARCDLAGLVTETLNAYTPQLEAGGFRVAITLPDQSPQVQCDRDAISQVLVNLLSNAEKYAADGREIRVELMSLSDPQPCAELRVLDRGPGVPAGCEERIFEQFCRAHDSLDSGIQGSGLGLTLARKIALAHGGELTYRPREGGGSCFSLRLPMLTN